MCYIRATVASEQQFVEVAMRVTVIYDEESLAKAQRTLAAWVLSVPHALGTVRPSGNGDPIPEDDDALRAVPGGPRGHRA